VLGGPVLGEDKRIIGMNIDFGHDGPRDIAYVSFLPLTLLCRYLKHFRILKYVFYISSIYELHLPLLAYIKPLYLQALEHYDFNTVICRFILIWFMIPLPADGYLRHCLLTCLLLLV
jgi:hypothetical protein